MFFKHPITSIRMVCLLGFLSTGLGIAAPAQPSSKPKSQIVKGADGAQSPANLAGVAPKGLRSRLARNEKPKSAAAKKPAATPGVSKQPVASTKTQSPKPRIKGTPPTKNNSTKAKALPKPDPKKTLGTKPAKNTNKADKLKSGGPKTASQKPIKTRGAVTKPVQGSGALSSTGKNDSKAKKSVKNAKAKAKAPKAPSPPEPAEISAPEDETDWLSVGLGAAVVALGLGGLFWHRSRQKASKKDESIDFQSSDTEVSTFVSNVTAFDLVSNSGTGTGVERRGKRSKAKSGGAKKSEHPSMTQADQQMMEASPLSTTRGSQQIAATNPPASNAPSQIVVPKKSKTPAAS